MKDKFINLLVDVILFVIVFSASLVLFSNL